MSVRSPLQAVLPRSIADTAFIDGISRIRFAEVQGFLGFDIPRPSAPFPAANGWGSTVGLLTPFFFFSWLRSPFQRKRRIGWVLAAVAVIPMVVSLNRGLVLSLGVALLSVAVRRGISGNWSMLRNVVGGMFVVVLLVALTPLSGYVTGKLNESTNSNDARSSIYVEAFNGSLESPIIGHGTPGDRDGAPPVGSHGLLWWIMYCHGFVALALFLAWLVERCGMGCQSGESPRRGRSSRWLSSRCRYPCTGCCPSSRSAGLRRVSSSGQR